MPDRSSIQATVEGDGESRESAYAAAAALASAVDALLETERGALDRVSTAALLVHPKTRWRKGEQQRTGWWRATRTSVIEVVDLARVGDLLAQLVAAGAAVTGPWWELDASHPARHEARRRAAEDARRRADAYAEALGLTVGKVAWVSEPGVRLAGDSRMPMAGGGEPRMRGAAAAEESIDISPEEITVRSVVEVAFTVEQ